MSGNVAMRTLYFKPRLVNSLPRQCCVVNVPALLRELILEVCASDGKAIYSTSSWTACAWFR
jgi:hypothetical protein